MNSEDAINNLMVIDDDEVDQLLYRRVVERSGIVTSLVAFTRPAEALEFLRNAGSDIPDLILLDIRMPGMDGFEFLDHLANEISELYSQLRVVMVSTSTDPSDASRASSYSAVKSYINKPISGPQLRDLAQLMKQESESREDH